MKKIPLLFLLGIIAASPFVFPQASKANLEITTENIFELGKRDYSLHSQKGRQAAEAVR